MVVDDEQLAREELCYVLDEVGGVEVVAQAGNGFEAVDAIGRQTPDLVFLDVQMPGLTGFEVARRLVDREPPVTIVFVTAFDQHAIEAFEVNAVDYLLKPVEAPGSKRPSNGPGAGSAPDVPLNDQLERIVRLVEARKPPVRAGRREGRANGSCWCRPRTSFMPRWPTSRLIL